MAVGANPTPSSPLPEETPLLSNQHTTPQISHANPSQPQINIVNQSVSSTIDLNQTTLAPQRSYSDIVKGCNQSNTSAGIQPLLINNHQELDFTSIGLKPTSSYQGKPAVLFSLSERKLLVDKLKFVLVGKFSHGRPNLVRIKKFLGGLKLKGSCSVSLLDKKHIFIECLCKIDYYRIWLKLVWFIDGFPMRVFKWTADFSPLKESPIVPVWVRLEGLPLFLFDELYLLSVANTIGKPIRVDPRNVTRSIVNSARICVELDVSQPLLQELWVNFEDDKTGVVIEGYWVKVSYDVTPHFCVSCSHIGHEVGNCKRRVETQVRNKGSDENSDGVLDLSDLQQPKSSVKFVEGPQKNVTQLKGGQQVLGMLANQVLCGSPGVLGSFGTQSDLEEAKNNLGTADHSFQVSVFVQNLEQVKKVENVEQVEQIEQIEDVAASEQATLQDTAGENDAGEFLVTDGENAAGKVFAATLGTDMMARQCNIEAGTAGFLGEGHASILIVQGSLDDGVDASENNSKKQTPQTLEEHTICVDHRLHRHERMNVAATELETETGGTAADSSHSNYDILTDAPAGDTDSRSVREAAATGMAEMETDLQQIEMNNSLSLVKPAVYEGVRTKVARDAAGAAGPADLLTAGVDGVSSGEAEHAAGDGYAAEVAEQQGSWADLVEEEHEQQFAREQNAILEWDATQVKAFIHQQIEEIKQEIGQTELKIRDAAKEEKGEAERARKSTAQEKKQLARELKFVRERKNLKEYFRASAEKINSDFLRKRSEKKEKTTGISFKYGEV